MATVSPGLNGEGDAAQNPVPLGTGNGLAILLDGHAAVGKPDVVELDPARSAGLLFYRRRLNVGLGVKQFENSLGGGHRRLQNVELLAQILDGAEKSLGVHA